MIAAMIGDARDRGAEKPPLMLVCLQPRSYSDTIGQVIGELRPDLVVRVVEPPELAERVLCLNPDLVLCSQPNTVARDGGELSGTSWVEYYPYAEPPEEEIRVDGSPSGQRSVGLEDLLALVDRVLIHA